jgi:hypothetical protein
MGGIPYVFNPLGKLISGGNMVHISHLSFPGAMPAIHGTHITHMEKHTVGVAMGQARDRAVAVFRERIIKLCL